MKIGGVSTFAIIAGCLLCHDAWAQSYVFKEARITVDGDVSDWSSATWYPVAEAKAQWFGQGITAKGWQGPSDLSYSWAGAWDGKGKLYFAFKVKDDVLVDPPAQPNSFLNDCIEILIDWRNSNGPRYLELDGKKELRGYEMHFLPVSEPLVFVDDALSPLYPVSNPQNDLFRSKYAGEIGLKRHPTGYTAEIGLAIPGFPLGDGAVLGIDTDICDDDGKGRESLLLWHSGQVDFWLTMDHYGKVILRKSSTE